MKKILWICNTPLPEIQKEVGVRNYNESWLIGISNQLRKIEDLDFHYAFPQNKYRKTLNKRIDGINFWGFYNCHKNSYKIENQSIQILELLISKIDPDIIHIFGTELPHSLECINSISDKSKVIVSLQGLVSEIAKVYVRGIPFPDRLLGGFQNGRYQCLLTEQYEFYKRGINEKKILSTVNSVIGRTDWDKRCVKQININCQYYSCNETLRDTFYDGTWDIENIQKYSIFVSQGNYPVKGLHVLIEALPLIKRRFPEVMVYIAGNKSFLELKTSYGRYIKKILRKYSVEENFVFLGYQTAEQIRQSLMKAHVMLMPSLIENSPNSIGEAMLIGTPVVASRVGGIPSILHDGTEGYLYSCMNTKELARRVNRIFQSDNLALRFSRNGRKIAGNIYDFQNNIEQLLSIYNQL